MLDIVVFGVTGAVLGMLAAVQEIGVVEGSLELGRPAAVEQVLVDAANFRRYRRGIGDADRVSDVVIAAAHGGFSVAEYRDTIS